MGREISPFLNITMKIYNTHIHIFKNVDVPNKFLPLYLVRILSTKKGLKIISKILNNLNPFSSNDVLDRYVRFATIGNLGSQKKIFEECAKFYPQDTEFVILPMDMAYMGAGSVPRNYRRQLMELAQLKKEYPQMHPFIHIDPRRQGFFSTFKKTIDEWGFEGVKIYPSLGYFPYDEKLEIYYQYCEEKGLPIISHGGPDNPVHYRGSKKEIKEMLKGAKIPYVGKTKKELCSNFTDPRNWEYVAKKYPKLNICIAHFGSEYYWEKYLNDPTDKNTWFYYIRDLIDKYDNIYTDISFTLNNQKYFSVLKVLLNDIKLKERILFGSDYYMVKTKTEEKKFAIDLRAYLGEELFKQISYRNPRTFLNK